MTKFLEAETRYPVVVGPLTSPATGLLTGETRHPLGHWQGILESTPPGRVEWKCSHQHTSRTAARKCAREKWFAHLNGG
jgi:hypothetical protein